MGFSREQITRSYGKEKSIHHFKTLLILKCVKYFHGKTTLLYKYLAAIKKHTKNNFRTCKNSGSIVERCNWTILQFKMRTI